MSTDRDTTRIVRSWLRADEHVSADRLLDEVLRAVDTTPQRRFSWLARRSPVMNNTVRLVLAAAAVVAVALIGYRLLIAPNVVGPVPNVSPTPEASVAPSGSTSLVDEVYAGALAAGTYTANAFDGSDVNIRFTVPDGWNWNDWYLAKPDVGPPDGAGVSFWTGDVQVYTDPCHWMTARPDPRTGPDAAAVIDALAAQPMRDAGEPVDRAASGPDETWPGMAVQLSVPSDIDFADCDSGSFRSWGPDEDVRYHQGPGQRDYVWAIDVGDVRVVVDAPSFPATSAEVTAEIEDILRSIVISR